MTKQTIISSMRERLDNERRTTDPIVNWPGSPTEKVSPVPVKHGRKEGGRSCLPMHNYSEMSLAESGIDR